eukprot:Skav234160  [mRNA]  locus=scaffold572:66643:67359:- [translate_table: standard]
MACWAAGISLVGPMDCCQFHGCLAGCEVHGLEDVFVQAASLIALKRQLQHQECISQTLHSQSNWPMAHVGTTSFFHWIVVSIDHFVQVLGNHLRHFIELLEVKNITLHKGRQGNGRKVADRNLIWGGVLNDLCAQIGAMDGAQVLLVGLPIAVVFVQHVGRARLHLGLQNPEPQVLSLDGLSTFASCFQFDIEPFEVFSPQIHQTFASLGVESLIGTEQGPILVLLHSLHEEIRDPKS